MPRQARLYKSKDAKEAKTFDALEWLAAMASHVPHNGEQMVRYYGYYSNVSRGKRKKEDNDELIPSILEPDGSSKQYKRNWARLIQKIYEVDPLTCPKCHGRMRIIGFIEDAEVIKRMLKHLNLWDKKARPPSLPRPHIDASISRLPLCEDHLYCDPEFAMEASFLLVNSKTKNKIKMLTSDNNRTAGSRQPQPV